MTTIREHLEAIRDRHTHNQFRAFGMDWCAACQRKVPCPDHADALAALAELDASQPQCLDDPPGVSHRLVPDPQETT